MNWTDIRILYLRELRSALRERSIVINGILMPVFLYPVLLWVMFSALTFIQGVTEGFTARMAIVESQEAPRVLLDSLTARNDVEIRDPGSRDAALDRLSGGELDAVVSFEEVTGQGSAVEGNVGLRVHYDRSEERSRQALARVEAVADWYREQVLDERASALGIEESQRLPYRVEGTNISSEREMGAFLLGQMVPLFLVIMVALGCFVPSVDTTAGERERSTWETLMTVSASRLSIVTAKYLYVATLGIVAGVLNVVAIFVSIGAVIQPLLGNAGESLSFSIPWLAVPVMMAGAVALALFFGAAMMILASFARTFKDGQAMVTPVYWLALLPLILGQQTDQTLTPTMAAIPVANVAMMVRDAITGVFVWPLIAQTFLVTLAMVAACLALARVILGFEDFLLGAYDGSFWRFLKDRVLGSRKGDRPAADPTPSPGASPGGAD